MAIQVSPGINVSEFDTTTVIPAVSTSVGAVAGVFQWGPGYQRTLIDSENTLVQKFGKPTANNFETFFTAANFLAYGNALYVVRAYDATALNAVANTAAMTAPQIDNADDWRDNFVANAAAYANATYIAKFPGTLGNSLKVSVCDSANAYSSMLLAANASVGVILNYTPGSNQISVWGGSSAAGSANAAANGVLNQIAVGDYIKAGNATVGFQFLKVTAKDTAGVEGNANATVNVASFTYQSVMTVNVDAKFALSGTVQVTSNTTAGAERYWEFYNAVDKAPGTSTFMTSQGLTTKDELHIVVSDAGGKFSGTQNSILEVWSNLSRATDAKTTSGASNYYKNVIDTQSAYVYAGTARSTSPVGLASTLSAASNTTPYSATFNLGTDGAAETTITLGPVALAYDLFADKADVDLSLVMQGKAIGTTPGGLGNYIIANIAEHRKDCVAFVSPDLSIVTSAQTRDPVQYAVDFRGSTGGISGLNYNSSYAVMDTGYKYQYDKYNDLYRWVPLNGDIAGLCALTDQTRDSWYSPAGFNRGQIKNVVKLQFNPNQAQRDLLYKNDVNPVVQFPGQGTVLYGDKTLLGKPSAFDRINVRRLFITLEKAIENASRSSLFEFNDSFTRAQFKNLVEPFLRQVQGRRGIYDFRVVCDETNNTGQVIDSNQFVGDIYIKPAKSINFIQLNFVAVRTGVDFNTIVGQF